MRSYNALENCFCKKENLEGMLRTPKREKIDVGNKNKVC